MRRRNPTLTEEELKELIDDLNVDEAADLVAITWVGRGDFEAAEFEQAQRERRSGRPARPRPT